MSLFSRHPRYRHRQYSRSRSWHPEIAAPMSNSRTRTTRSQIGRRRICTQHCFFGADFLFRNIAFSAFLTSDRSKALSFCSTFDSNCFFFHSSYPVLPNCPGPQPTELRRLRSCLSHRLLTDTLFYRMPLIRPSI